MTARDLILSSIRRSLGVTGAEAPRRKAVEDRLTQHPAGIVPARGNLPPAERLALFRTMVEAAAGTIEEIPHAADVPAAVSAFLRAKNLPMKIRRGEDPRLGALPWQKERTLDVAVGAESGTLMLTSGPSNPTTLNFLPDTHIVVLDARDIAGDYETLWARLRERFGDGVMPRTVNLVTGPSRSADIEQTLILGAHGPRRLHVMVVGEVA